jgi:hypothetical protein
MAAVSYESDKRRNGLQLRFRILYHIFVMSEYFKMASGQIFRSMFSEKMRATIYYVSNVQFETYVLVNKILC